MSESIVKVNKSQTKQENDYDDLDRPFQLGFKGQVQNLTTMLIKIGPYFI